VKLIPLTQGKFAMVDDADHGWLIQWKWYFHSQGYAARSLWIAGENRSTCILMHNVINPPVGGLETDHLDRDRLNNQRSNLKSKTHSGNMHNQSLRVDNTTGAKGVHFLKRTGRWQAYIDIDGKRHHLGYFTTKGEAVAVRLQAQTGVVCV
jgi:hypothetical protein